MVFIIPFRHTDRFLVFIKAKSVKVYCRSVGLFFRCMSSTFSRINRGGDRCWKRFAKLEISGKQNWLRGKDQSENARHQSDRKTTGNDEALLRCNQYACHGLKHGVIIGGWFSLGQLPLKEMCWVLLASWASSANVRKISVMTLHRYFRACSNLHSM